MLKRFVSVVVCFIMAFSAVTAVFSANGFEVEAAKVYETPYYYNQLSDNAKSTYKTLKKKVLECKKSVMLKVDINQEDFNKISELLILHDPMTFNLKNIEATTYSNSTIEFKMTYKYKKESYDKMVAAYEKKVDKILAKLTDDMSTYKKIRIIHDSIINTAVYDLNSKNNDTIYGALVKKKSKCDGYSKTFTYICGQAGIRTATVIGYDKNATDGTMHMWNKVYYNKKWYNVDVTWDDPISNFTDNMKHDFFMVSDSSLSNTHKESNLSFKVPAANDNSKNYYSVNKKYAEDLSSAVSIIKKGLTTAAKNGKTSVELKCSSNAVFNQVEEYVKNTEKICNMLDNVNAKSKNSKMITELYSYSTNEYQNVIKIYVFHKGTELDDYYVSTDKIDKDMVEALAEYGIC